MNGFYLQCVLARPLELKSEQLEDGEYRVTVARGQSGDLLPRDQARPRIGRVKMIEVNLPVIFLPWQWGSR